MNNQPHREFTRFILNIICNNCGLNGQVQLSWQPDVSFVAKCFRCGDAEKVMVGPTPMRQPEPPVENEDDAVLGGMVRKMITQKTKEPNRN